MSICPPLSGSKLRIVFYVLYVLSNNLSLVLYEHYSIIMIYFQNCVWILHCPWTICLFLIADDNLWSYYTCWLFSHHILGNIFYLLFFGSLIQRILLIIFYVLLTDYVGKGSNLSIDHAFVLSIRIRCGVYFLNIALEYIFNIWLNGLMNHFVSI